MARSEDRDRRRRLRKMMKKLQEIDPYEILPYLTCLSEMRTEQIRAKRESQGAMVAAGELFEELPKRENWYRILVQALREIGKDKLADELEGPEKQTSPSGSSQSVATGNTSHYAPMSQSQGRQQHPPPPASDPHLHASQERRPEAEASVTPGYPVEGAEGHKGEEKNVRSGPDENPAQQPPSGASLQMPVQERKHEPQSRESGAGGARAISPSLDVQPQARESGPGDARVRSPSFGLQGPDDSGSDESNTSPKSMERGTLGEAKENAGRVLPGNTSSSADTHTVGVSVRTREAARGWIEEDVEERKRREVRRDDEEWNIQNESNQVENLHLQKTKDNTVKINNLSPTKDSGKFNWNSDKTSHLKAHNVVEGRENECRMTDVHSLSSSGGNPRADARALREISESKIMVGMSKEAATSRSASRLQQIDERTGFYSLSSGGGNPREDARALSGMSESEILNGISKEPTAFQSGSRLQQIDERTCNAASIGGGQGMGGGGSGTGEMGAADGSDAVSIGGMQGRGERVSGSEEMGAAGGMDASNDNQGSVMKKVGSLVRAYLPSVLNSVGDHMLSQ